jgi:hypothetical protein
MSQGNLISTDSTEALENVFKTCGDKLVCIMMYRENGPDCKRARNSFIKGSEIHTISVFCMVDVDKFQGDSEQCYSFIYLLSSGKIDMFCFVYQ